MNRWKNRIAVVTGASSGIGAAIAIDLVKSGVVVVGLARRVEMIAALSKSLPENLRSKLHSRKCDVTKESEVRSAFNWIDEHFGGTDILVSNAGCQRFGNLCTMDTQRLHEVIGTNLMGSLYCTQQAFRSMKSRNFDGHVVLINSIFGHTVFYTGGHSSPNIYPATKHALTAINEILRQEFDCLGTKVKVTSISPGLVDTDLVPKEIKSAFGSSILSPSDVSSAVLYAIGTPPNVVVHELILKPMGEKF